MGLFQISDFISALKRQHNYLEGDLQGSFSDLISDTRELEKLPADAQVLFFARKGTSKDGHDFLKSLESNPRIRGFVVDRVVLGLSGRIPSLQVRNTTEAMALAVKLMSGDPTASAFTLAVTGTNGKTTTTFLAQSLLNSLGKRCGRMGTIETEFEGFAIPSDLTTPDFSAIQKIFSDFRQRGADAFAFEASSHALEQKRLLGLELDVAMFTNLTPEHLDYHGSMEKYYLAKRRLFFELLEQSSKRQKFAIVPQDGAYGTRLLGELKSLAGVQSVSWGYADAAQGPMDVLCTKWATSLSGSQMSVKFAGDAQVHSFESSLVGEYNIDNLLGIFALGFALKVPAEIIQKSMHQLRSIPGRLERVLSREAKNVFVDYAHTPDALENVLSTLRKLTPGKLRVVFGCGGDRDRSKRPKMGALAELYADEVYVTSDNPRTEDPDAIIEEILQGVQRVRPIHVNVDRKSSIEESLKNLSRDDAVLIAGKGHETYQILGTQKIHFDDREIARQALNH